VLSYNVCQRITCSYIVVYLLQMMEIELRKLADTIKSIHEEMYYLRERYNICLFVLAMLKLHELIIRETTLKSSF
jgi:hypothetical protein